MPLFLQTQFKIFIKLRPGFFTGVKNSLNLAVVFISSRYFNINRNAYLKLCYKGISFRVLISNLDDIETIKEIFIEEIYSIDDDSNIKNCKFIVDLGSNIGLSVIYFAIVCPRAQIFSVEPSVTTFNILKANTELFPNIVCVQCFISSKTGMDTFYISQTRSHSSSLINRGDSTKITLQSYTLSDFCKEFNLEKIDLLKFDIEGAEFNMLSDLLSLSICRFVGEIHTDLTDRSYSKDLGLGDKFFINTSPGIRRYNIKGISKNYS